MATIDEILKKIPADAKIASYSYEGANIVIYTKSKAFFKHGGDIIRHLVDEFKKRIDLRADPSIRIDEETAEKVVRKVTPKEADITNVIFEPARSLITIEAKRPGLAIGKTGENLKELKDKTLWTVLVKRESMIPSKITQNIRSVLYQDSTERRKFLDKVGKRIYETRKYSGGEMWARIAFLGGGRQVGRSCLLLQTPESNVLLDCGVDVASDMNTFPYLAAPEFHIQDLDAVIISHAHLDHSGALPLLLKYGYTGPIYCTEPTRDAMSLLQLDYIEVSHSQAKKSPYSSTDIKNTVKNTICLEYGEVTDITPDVRLTFYNAGHILGSCLSHLHIGEGWHNLIYSGDYKVKRTQLLDPAHSNFPRVETFITESTYGGPDSIMPPREESEAELKSIIRKTIKRKGKVLMPVLGVGRAQEIMLIVKDLFEKEKLNAKVYIDGMVWDVTAIHNAYPRFMNSDVRQSIFYEGHDPFLSPIFKRVGSMKERLQVIEGGPCVILATSGMLVGGPALTYLGELAGNKKNSLIFTCYQGIGSLGSRIQSGEQKFSLDMQGKLREIDLGMELHTLSGFSGHADRNELISYVDKMQPSPRKVIVNHGESSRCLNIASTIHKSFKVETTAPKNLEVIRLK